MTRHGSRDGTHFRKKLLNADGPVERILILLVIAVVAGVTIGLLMPKANPTVGEITGEYTASGSAAQTLQQLTVDDNQRHAGYDRDLFGFRQTDDDGNGCDVREDVLARDLTDVRYRQHGCKVESARWPTRTPAKQSTSYAARAPRQRCRSTMWWRWRTRGSRVRTSGTVRSGTGSATTMYNLLAVDGPANQEKGSASAAYWLPTNGAYRCDYVARQIGVKAKYGLTVTTKEKRAMLSVLRACPAQAVPEK